MKDLIRRVLRDNILIFAVGMGVAFGAERVQGQSLGSVVSVGVGIRIAPVAQIEFPQGTGFELYIPSGEEDMHSREERLAYRGPFTPARAPNVATAQIPFTVIGNAWVTVSVEPGEFLEPRHEGSVGLARPDDPDGPNQGVELPYRLRIEFPMGTPVRPIGGFDHARGGNPTQDGAMSADASAGPVSGAIHVISAIDWGEISSHRFVNPGLYRGEIHVTITSTDY